MYHLNDFFLFLSAVPLFYLLLPFLLYTHPLDRPLGRHGLTQIQTHLSHDIKTSVLVIFIAFKQTILDHFHDLGQAFAFERRKEFFLSLNLGVC